MYCKNCGNQIDDNAVVCPNCGVATEKFNQAPAEKQKNTIAIVGFVLSFFIAIVGLICSIIGYKKSRELSGTGKGFALAGIIISVVEIVLSIILYATVFVAALSVV